MARGQQKIQSQQKNAKRLAEQKKRDAGIDGKSTAAVKLTVVCKVCKVMYCDDFKILGIQKLI